MTMFDSNILSYLNQFMSVEPAFDRGVKGVTMLFTTRGLPLITALWWIWARGGPQARRDREIVVATVFAGLVALLLGRLLAAWLPFRARPFLNPELGLDFPYESNQVLTEWSSFPSDHAMLWFAIAMGVFMASRWLGALALAFVAVVVCLPRVYTGMHYPTDILVGGVLGMLVCWWLCRPAWRERLAAPVLGLERRHPALFMVAMFLISFQLVTQFDDVRRITDELGKLT